MYALNHLIFSLFLLINAQFAPSKVEWTTSKDHDFGLVERGVEAKHVFTFKNISNAPLIIDNVRTDCSCTASDWDEAPIAPNAIGKITVGYDAKKKGFFRKHLTVWLHGQKQAEKLMIQGEVDEN
jgi:hypothetical protein